MRARVTKTPVIKCPTIVYNRNNLG